MKIEEKGGKFIIVDFNELDSYKIACKIERDGVDFYQRILDNERNRDAIKGPEFLIKEEKEHLKLFERRLLEVKQRIEDNFEEDDLLNYMEYCVFRPYQQIGGLSDKIDDAGKALRLGVAIEENSIRFYKACRDKVSSAGAKKELGNIIEEEKGHKVWCEDMLKGQDRKSVDLG